MHKADLMFSDDVAEVAGLLSAAGVNFTVDYTAESAWVDEEWLVKVATADVDTARTVAPWVTWVQAG